MSFWIWRAACALGPTSSGSSTRTTTSTQTARRAFYQRIREYWPGLPDNSLIPDYAGIRPKLTGQGEAAVDFMIDAPQDHGVPRLVQLFGIESPGLTSALSLGEEVAGYLDA